MGKGFGLKDCPAQAYRADSTDSVFFTVRQGNPSKFVHVENHSKQKMCVDTKKQNKNRNGKEVPLAKTVPGAVPMCCGQRTLFGVFTVPWIFRQQNNVFLTFSKEQW